MRRIEVKRGPDGVWYTRPYLGTNVVTKKPIRPYRRFPNARTKEEALEEAKAWISKVMPSAEFGVSPKLAEVLQRYIAWLETSGSPANTIKTYTSLVRCYIEPYIGEVSVDDIRPYMVSALYNTCLAKEGISPNTVIKLHWFLCGAWKWMAEEEITPYNPMLSVNHPKKETLPAAAFNEQELLVLCEALADAMSDSSVSNKNVFARNVAMAAYLALWNSERCGEVCANTRADADLLRKTMRIAGTAVENHGKVFIQKRTKGKRIRNVAMADETCQEIEKHYLWQRSYLSASKVKRQELTIVCDKRGGILRPSKVSAAFSNLRDDLGLPPSTSFHTLRHTSATWMLLNGATLADVKERLGHRSETTTLGLYIHLLPGRDQEVARMFANAMKRVKERGNE